MIIYIFTSENLKTRVLIRIFGTQYPFEFVWAGKEFQMDIM